MVVRPCGCFAGAIGLRIAFRAARGREEETVQSRDWKMKGYVMMIVSVLAFHACQPLDELGYGGDREAAGEQEEVVARSSTQASESAGPVRREPLERLAQRPRGDETVCQAFSRAIAESALSAKGDREEFLTLLRKEFIDGASNPFEMKAGLRELRWNERYFYAGHGGFRHEYDDAQRYPRGGNHQPGHFISVFSIAADFGEEQARMAIAFAGDYDEGDEDDLRLSNVAIPLGAGLRDGSVSPTDVAIRARELCRN
jgi:hypothetical protein